MDIQKISHYFGEVLVGFILGTMYFFLQGLIHFISKKIATWWILPYVLHFINGLFSIALIMLNFFLILRYLKKEGHKKRAIVYSIILICIAFTTWHIWLR